MKAELSLQAEALALDMKDLWGKLKPRGYLDKDHNSISSLTSPFMDVSNSNSNSNRNRNSDVSLNTNIDVNVDMTTRKLNSNYDDNSGSDDDHSSNNKNDKMAASKKAHNNYNSQQLKIKDKIKMIECCQLFLAKLSRAGAIYIAWTDELEQNCEALNDEITRDKESYREGAGLR